jgi:hypothetical protein
LLLRIIGLLSCRCEDALFTSQQDVPRLIPHILAAFSLFVFGEFIYNFLLYSANVVLIPLSVAMHFDYLQSIPVGKVQDSNTFM